MKQIFLFTLFLMLSHLTIGQINSRQLNEDEVNSIFTQEIKNEFNIEYPIFRIYEFNDKAGKHFLVLTEHKIECKEKKECFDKLQALCFIENNNKMNLEWSLKDFILEEGNEVSEEYSITFWTKYFELNDYDQNGYVDPIILYGTIGMNGYMDGRIKILIYQNGQKYAVRHQNGTLDHERNTKVDAAFYELPKEIQLRVTTIMEKITENDHGIFPYGWQKAMERKQLSFDEN